MRLTVTLELDDAAIGDDFRFPVIADLLIRHAGDVLQLKGGGVLGKRIGYGAHNVVVGLPNNDHEPFPEPDVMHEHLVYEDSMEARRARIRR